MLEVTEQDAWLPELLKYAEAGETVIITRNGRPLVELRAAPAEPKGPPWATVEEELAWLDRRRVTPRIIGNAADDIREMRDEE